jgi:hypothetical protein
MAKGFITFRDTPGGQISTELTFEPEIGPETDLESLPPAQRSAAQLFNFLAEGLKDGKTLDLTPKDDA